MRIYIAGPMTGKPGYNYPAFFEAEQQLRALGVDPVNPATLHGDAPIGSLSHSAYMRTDLRALLDCDAIYMLRGWHASKGARCEYQVAHCIGLRVLTQESDEKMLAEIAA